MSIDNWTLDHQFHALLGSIAHMLVFVWNFKQLKDKNRTKNTWGEFWKVSWDDLLMIPLLGQVMAFMIEPLFGLYAYNVNTDLGGKSWSMFFDNIEAISFLMGVFGSVMFLELMKAGRGILSIISKKLTKQIKNNE